MRKRGTHMHVCDSRYTWTEGEDCWLVFLWRWVKQLCDQAVCMHGMVVDKLCQGPETRLCRHKEGGIVALLDPVVVDATFVPVKFVKKIQIKVLVLL